MTRYPEFKQALVRWRKAAVRHMDAGPEPVMRIGLQRWTRQADGSLRKVDSLQWNYVRLAETYQTSEFHELVIAANKHQDIKKHLDTLVGTPYSSRSLSLQDIAQSFLPRLELADDGEHANIIPQSTRLYDEFEKFIASDEVKVTTLWPIGSIQIEKPIKIAEGIEIRRLKDEELASALSFGIVRPNFPEAPIMPQHEENQSGLFYTYKLPKVIGHNKNPSDDFTKLEQDKVALLEKVLTVAAVVDIRGIRFSGRAEKASGWPSGFNSASWNGIPYPSFTFGKKVAEKEAQAFRKTWDLLFGHGGPVDKSLYLAARRLAFAEERVRSDDALLDMMIAAEALYLGSDGAKDRGELKYRLSLRAAHWANTRSLDATKKEVFELMKSAYDVRSSIAHGGTPKSKQLKYKEQQLGQIDFNIAVEKVVRLGLQKAIRLTAKTENRKFKPEWDESVIEKLAR